MSRAGTVGLLVVGLAMVGGAAAMRLGSGDVRSGTERVTADSTRERVLEFWTRYRAANADRIAGELPAAIAGYRAALDLNPEHEDALYYLGNLRFQLAGYREAESAWLRLVHVNPQSARGWLQLGMLYGCPDRQSFFRPDSARAVLERAHEINKEETGALLRLAQLEVLTGDSKGATEHLDAVLKTNHSSVLGYFMRGYLAWRIGDRARATLLLQAALEAARPPSTTGRMSAEGDTRAAGPLRLPDTGCARVDARLQDLDAIPGSVSELETEQLYERVHTAFTKPSA